MTRTRDLPGLSLDVDATREGVRDVLDLSGADGVEVVVTSSTIGLTRYARSEIIQNTIQETRRVYVRVVEGRSTASASTNQLEAEHLLAAAQNALETARVAPADPDFVGLPSPDEVGRAEGIWRYDDATAAATPERRAEEVQRILRLTSGVEAAGIVETSAHGFAIFTSQGIECSDAYTRCVASCLANNGESTGWCEASSHTMSEVDVEAMAGVALNKAQTGSKKTDLAHGTYEVVLEPAAVAMLLEYLAYSGFGAKQVLDGESFLSTRMDAKLAPESVTVADDVRHDRSVGIGFDFEGVPKQRVAVIDAGRATGPVTDVRTARRLGIAPTGHGSGSSEFGPYAANVVMQPGDATREDLVAGVSDGLLVTRFHYVNILDRPSVLLTGMTRDGTFRIRNGEIAEPVHNLRFAHSALDAMADVEGVGRELEAFAPEFGSFGSTAAPALRINAFHFSSRTSH